MDKCGIKGRENPNRGAWWGAFSDPHYFARQLTMFMGEYNHTVDTKGRLIIPAKFREQLGEEFVVTRGFDDCLLLYPQKEWAVFEQTLRTLPLAYEETRMMQRHFVAGASECELDKQGRILLPAVLREYAGLEKDVVLAGMIEKVEIWSKSKWSEATDSKNVNLVARKLMENGITF